jgi:O-antigen/teichoic acid export membrane protein
LAQIVLCALLTVIMIHRYGLLGAAMGSGAALALGGIVYIFHSSHIFRIPFSFIMSPPVLRESILLITPSGLLWVLHHYCPSRDLFLIVIQCVLYSLAYGFLVLRYSIDDYDIEKISQVIPFVRYLHLFRPHLSKHD